MVSFLPEKLPENLAAERSLLGAIAAGACSPYPEAQVEAYQAAMTCKPEYFVAPKHRLIFESVQRLYSTNTEITVLTIRADMQRNGTLERIGGELTDIGEVINSLGDGPAPGIGWLVSELEQHYTARRLLDLTATAQRQVIEGEESIGGILSELQAALAQTAMGQGETTCTDDQAAIDQLNEGIPFREPGEAGGRLAWFGLSHLDDETDGLECAAGHMGVVGARAGTGKTALLVQIAMETARRGFPSLTISLEMDRHEMRSRRLAWLTGTPYAAFRHGNWPREAVHRANAERELFGLTRTWPDEPGVSWGKIEAVIANSVRLHGVRLALIDHAHLIGKPNLGKNANDAAAWSEIARRIKALAQRLRICIIALVQLNRQAEGVEPKKSEIRESGGFEEYANFVLLLYPKVAQAQEGYQPKTDIYIKAAKVRSGPSGWKQLLTFHGATSRFTEKDPFAESAEKPTDGGGYLV